MNTKILFIFFLTITSLVPAQSKVDTKRSAWLGTALMWNIPQDLFGFEIAVNAERKGKDDSYWNNYLSCDLSYGRKFFESGIFSELPEDRIESITGLTVLLGKGHHFENSILIFKGGISLNEMNWRGKETGSNCNSFFCLGRYHSFAYQDIFRPGLGLETEYAWQVTKHIGMGVSIFGQLHPSYEIASSPFNNNYIEGGIRFYLFQFGRFEN